MTAPGPASDSVVVEAREPRGWTCQDNGGKVAVVPVSVEIRARGDAARIPR